MSGHNCSGADCRICEQRIADIELARASAPVEKPDRWGRDADWNWPRGYAGDRAVPW